jgi:hypothetical protein
MRRIDCRRCRHYFVTWDDHAPHGCRAIQFKSRLLPAQVVQRVSGRHCLKFSPKAPIPPPKG